MKCNGILSNLHRAIGVKRIKLNHQIESIKIITK